MQLRTLTIAIVVCQASLNAPVTATFRSIPIALPPIGKPVRLRSKGTYPLKLVHQWPPLQFDRWTPVEYYEPYGYVYECEDDGREYVFDSHATRPVIRAVAELMDDMLYTDPALSASQELATADRIFSFEKADGVAEPQSLVTIPALTVPAAEAAPAPAELIVETGRPLLIAPRPLGLHSLRGVVESLTTLPATFLKDALIQGRAMIVGNERRFFDLERVFGDVFQRDCAGSSTCLDAADTWSAYIIAVQEKAAEVRDTIAQLAAPLYGKNIDKDALDDEIVASIGASLIERIESARKMLISEVEALPSVVDKSKLVQLLVTPLEYLQAELEDKTEGPKTVAKQDLYLKGVDMINRGSLKIETVVAGLVDGLTGFPKHILHDLRREVNGRLALQPAVEAPLVPITETAAQPGATLPLFSPFGSSFFGPVLANLF